MTKDPCCEAALADYEASDERPMTMGEKEAFRIGFLAGKVELARVICCTRCGSLLDLGQKGYPGHDRRCDWCPACAPGMPWRYGPVLDESGNAKKLRES